MKSWMLALLGTMRLAHAEPSQVGETPFVTLDRVDGQSRGRVDFAFGGGTDLADFTAHPSSTTRLDVHGQGVWQRDGIGFGGYVTAGVGRVTYDGEDKPIGFSSIELGGLHVRRVNEELDL